MLNKAKHFFSILIVFVVTNNLKAQYVSALTDADIANRSITANTTVGVIDGSHGTSASGAATYTIPIKVAPGINGMEPELSIIYNSQSGNGLLGMGWNLNGLSAITLDNKDIYFDNTIAPVILGNSPYKLDGMRLIPENAGSNIFHPEVEDFSVITATGTSGAPQSFNVQTKTGAQIEYGNIAGSINAIVQTSENIPYLWRVAKMKDANGNTIKYQYSYANGESRIEDILYGSNGNIKVHFTYSTRTDKNSSFVSKSIFDNNNGVMNNHSLLTFIEITTDNVLVKKYEFKYMYDGLYSFLQEVKEIGSDNASVINSTLLKYGTPTDLTTPSAVPVANTNITSGYLLDFIGSENYTGDFNGDGLADILTVYYSSHDDNGNGNDDPYGVLLLAKIYRKYKIFLKVPNSNDFTEAYTYNFPSSIVNNQNDRYSYLLKVADFNGDGLSDILIDRYIQTFTGACCVDKNNLSIVYSLPTTSGVNMFATDYNGTEYLPYGAVSSPSATLSDNILEIGDFDGDGAMDILHTLSNSSNEKRVLVSFPAKGEYYTPVLVLADQILPSAPVNNVTITNKIVGIADFDGDKRDDLFTNARKIFSIDKWGGLYILRQISAPINPVFLPLSNNNKDFIGDFNGDGKADILTFYNSTANITYAGNGNNYTSTGLNFPNNITFDLPYIAPTDPNIYTNVNFRNTVPILADFNGDGKCDVMFLNHNQSANTSTLDICYSNGMGFVRAPTKTMPFDYYQLDLIADFNGDGALDILRKNTKFSNYNNFPYRISSLAAQSKERLLKKVVDGFNRVTEFNYKYLTDATTASSIYVDNTYHWNFTQNIITGLKMPLLLTSSVVMPDGVGGTNTTSYYYNNTLMHTKGKGFLGFSSTVTNESSTNENTLYIHQVPTASNFYSAPTTVVNTFFGTQVNTPHYGKTIQYNYIDKGSKRFLPQLYNSNEIDKINGTNITNTYTYDVNGNITQSITNNSNVETTTTTFTNIDNVNKFTVPYLYKEIEITTSRTGSVPFTKKTNLNYNNAGNINDLTINAHSSKPINIIQTYDGFGNPNWGEYSGSTPGGNIIFKKYTTHTTNGLCLKYAAIPNVENAVFIDDYDAKWAKPLKVKNYDGSQFQDYTYDNFGRVKTITPPASLGYYTEIKYEWAINPSINSLYKISTIANTTKVFADVIKYYDAFNRLVREETTENGKTKFTNTYYDAKGDITQTETNDANGGTITTNNTYDIYHRLLTSSNSTTSVTATNVYTSTPSAGVTIQNTTTGQPAKTTKIDPTGKIKEVTENSLTNTYTYHSNGNLLKVIQGSKELISCEYDENGNQTKLTDIDAGATLYEYDAFGNITKQTDANGNEMVMKYDNYNRLYNKTIKDNNYPTLLNNVDYYYNMPGVQGENKISEIDYVNNIDNKTIIDKFYYADNFDRITMVDRKFEDKNFITQYTYDKLNLKTIKYPKVTTAGTALTLTYTTTTDGFVTTVNANAGTSKNVFTASNTDYNAFDQITKYTLGSTFPSTATYNPIGLPTNYKATIPWFLNSKFQDLSMKWNLTTGNLTERTDASDRGNNRQTTVETFEYGTDNFNRLTKTKLSSQTSSLDIAYNDIGNIVKKYDAGSEYLYKSDKIHAVEKIKAGVGYTNPVKPDDRTDISILTQDIKAVPSSATSKYNAFNQPSLIIEGTNTLKYIYDYNGQRIKSIYAENGTVKTTRYYFGSYEFETTGGLITLDASIIRQLHYINAPNGLASILVKVGQTTPKYYSTYTDHLGSIVSVIDDNSSNILNASFYDQSFDAWGRQRNTFDWKTYTFTVPSTYTWLYRGYTGHEMLPKFNLINMNGRLYDPVVGRMLSPDNFVQDPFSTQSYNRYSYVLNNPLKYTDPSGQIRDDLNPNIPSNPTDGGSIPIDNVLLTTDGGSLHGISNGTTGGTATNSSSSNSSSKTTGDDDYFREFGDLEARGSLFMATNFYKYGYVGGLAPMVGALNYAIGNIAIGQQNRYNAIFNAANNTSLGIGVVNPSVSAYFYSVSSKNNDFINNATAGGNGSGFSIFGWKPFIEYEGRFSLGFQVASSATTLGLKFGFDLDAYSVTLLQIKGKNLEYQTYNAMLEAYRKKQPNYKVQQNLNLSLGIGGIDSKREGLQLWKGGFEWDKPKIGLPVVKFPSIGKSLKIDFKAKGEHDLNNNQTKTFIDIGSKIKGFLGYEFKFKFGFYK